LRVAPLLVSVAKAGLHRIVATFRRSGSMAVRDMEMSGGLEDSTLIDDAPTGSPHRVRRIFAAGAALLAGAVVCAVLLSGGAASAAVAPQPGSGLLRADAEPDSKFPWGYDEVEMCGVDYHIKKVLHSNLGGQGPDEGPEGIKYLCSESVNHKYKRDIIVEMNAMTHYQSKSAHMNGITHDFGSIHVDAGEHVKVLIHFQDLDGKPLELETFRMTFYDLDEAPHHLSQEYIIAEGHPSAIRDRDTQVHKQQVHGGVEFDATEIGSGADNPEDSSELTHTQKDRSVVLTYRDIKQFHVTMGSHHGHSPRAFEFALHSALTCHKAKLARTSTTTTTATATATTTTTTIDPKAIAAMEKEKQANLGKAAAIGGAVAATAAMYFLVAGIRKWFVDRELREIAYFEGTS